MLTESTEMYLITIYRHTQNQTHASVSDVADTLGLHHSSVSEKARRLVEQGYAHHDPEGLTLTAAGERVALNVLRKHRLMKTFMVGMLGYPLDDVYDEACRLEHAMSDRMADALEALLGNPEVDPHGYPIPTPDGRVTTVRYKTLNDFMAGDRVVVRRVDALNHEKLSYLQQLGLIPGATVTITEIAPFDGPLTLQIAGDGDRVVAIAPSLAQEIEVSAG